VQEDPASSGRASKPVWTAEQVGALLGAEVIGDPGASFSTLDSLDHAGSDALTFARSAKFARKWPESKGAAVLVSRAVYDDPSLRIEPGDGRAVLVVQDADLAMVALLDLAAKSLLRRPEPGVHPSAAIDGSVSLGAGVFIGAGVSIEAGTSIGDGTRLHPGVRIGAGVRIGRDCDLRANAVVEDRCILGDRVMLQPGAVIGADGFGYRPNPDGTGVIKIPHIGAVEIHDDVEIGANSCIDRGKFNNTMVGAGSKIDNLVQVGHNVVIGRATIICGKTGIGGSTKIGSGVTIGGACAIHDGVTIGDGATLAARSGVLRDVPPGGVYGGAPARPVKEYLRELAVQRHLPDMLHDYRERQLQKIEKPETPPS